MHSHFSLLLSLSLLFFFVRSIFPVCLFGFNKTSLLFRSQSDSSHLQVDILCRTKCTGRWEHISKIIIITIKFQVLGNYKMRRLCSWSRLLLFFPAADVHFCTGNGGEINGNKQMHVIPTESTFKRSHKIGHLPMNCINYAR